MAIEKVGIYRKWLGPAPKDKKWQADPEIRVAEKATTPLDCKVVRYQRSKVW